MDKYNKSISIRKQILKKQLSLLAIQLNNIKIIKHHIKELILK